MAGIKAKVAADAVAQYGIAKRGGDPLQVCAQAGLVVAAFLQAKDEPSYQTWLKTKHDDCAKVGIPKP